MRLPFVSSLDKKKKFISRSNYGKQKLKKLLIKFALFFGKSFLPLQTSEKNAFDLIPPEKKKNYSSRRISLSFDRSIRESVYQTLLFSSYRRVKKIKQTNKFSKQKNEYKPKKQGFDQDDFSRFSFKKNHHKM